MAYEQLWRRIALRYLQQRGRIISYEDCATFERDVAGGIAVVLPSALGGELRIPLDQPLPSAPAYRLTVLINLDQSVRLLYVVGASEQLAQQALELALLDYVHAEVGESGMLRMAWQLAKGGAAARLDPDSSAGAV